MGGNLSVPIENGVASFSGLSSNQPAGTGIVIQATPSPILPNPGPFESTTFTQ
jgi:hypothetical protein